MFTSFFAVFCCTMFFTAKADVFTGNCGTNLNWSFNSETGVLDITGSGEMNDYEDNYNVPWYDFFYSITAINLPNGLTYIGSRAFYSCWNLYSITIPETVTEYGSYIFQSCNSLRTVVWNAKNAKARYEEKVLFSTNITSFTFGNKVEAIPDYLCYNMWQLTSITIPNSVTSIGKCAFYECSGLSSITIPNSVTSIGNYAFQECIGLVSITLPENVTELGYNIFYQCSSLSSVIWNAKNAKRKKDNYGYEIFGYEVAPQITSFTIGNSVEVLPNYLCRDMSITSIVIPENVKEIGYEVFSGCKELRTVIWNARNAKRSVAEEDYYGSQIFYYEVAQNITSFTLGNAVEIIPDNLCAGMQQIPSITIPNSVTSIGNSAFSGCSSLPVITIPQNVTAIGNYAFSGCTNASVITVGKNVESIGRSSFSSNENLQVVNFLGTKVKTIGERAFGYCPALKSITLPDGVESLGENVFAECTFPAIVIPQSIKTIGEGLFAYNKNLKSVTISNPNAVCNGNLFVLCDSLENVTAPASALYIDITQIDYMPSHMQSITVTGGELTESAFDFTTHSYRTIKSLDCGAATNTALSDEAFKGCYNLQSLILPQNLTYVSYMAVAGCKNLKSIDIPASVEEIEQSAFEDCRSLEELTFGGKKPSSVAGKSYSKSIASQLRKIGNWAFYNAHELQHLEIPEGVEEIGDGAFYGCTYLQDLGLPSTVKKIGDNCFALCSKLEKITVTAVNPPAICARTFFDVNRAVPVYVPDEVVLEYQNDPYWQEMNIQPGAPTALDQITNDQSPITNKVIKDGHLLILRGNRTYTITGQEIK